MSFISCLRTTCAALACIAVGPRTIATAQDEYFIELRNGMRFGPGLADAVSSLSMNAFQQGGENDGRKPIGVVDDGLRRTYYNNSPRNLLNVQKYNAPRFTQIELPNLDERERVGAAPVILDILGVSPFSSYGRRRVSFMTPRGQVDVVQGITLLTPKYAKVEVLRAESDSFVWDQRIATTSIPSEQLREILHQALDLTQVNGWLELTGFYIEAERFNDARATISEAIQRFPVELADRVGLVKLTEQRLANQLFEEIKLRKASGQFELAEQLTDFPTDSLPVETQVKLQQEVDSIKQQVLAITDAAVALKDALGKLPAADQQTVAALIEEIFDEVSFDTAVRLSDFQRLRADASLPTENLVSLAVGGWILGPDAGIQNLAVAQSLIRVRALVKEYLDNATEPRRQQILQILQGEEGAQPALLAKLLANMKPPQALPPAQEDALPGFHRVSVNLPDGETMDYVLQLPPEYDPNRKYPCVLALPGVDESPEIEIEWWCGMNIPTPVGATRLGEATRHGYIVVAPDWMQEKQSSYGYTEGEKHRVLFALRDALRKTSVDTDRVFIAGHFDGATAAWDIAQSHPDMWAGAIMISPGADKYIAHYYENLKAQATRPDEIPLGTYAVFGGMDGKLYSTKMGTVLSRYLDDPSYDALAVEYIGRGSERFLSELPRIMEWMELSSHRRVRTPREINAVTMRPGDRFFYWLEVPQVLPNAAGNPIQFDPKRAARFEASIFDAAINGVQITSLPSLNRDAIVWLTPEMVDFSRTISVKLGTDRNRQELKPDIAVMLEDARRRGERMHVFWQRVVVQ